MLFVLQSKIKRFVDVLELCLDLKVLRGFALVRLPYVSALAHRIKTVALKMVHYKKLLLSNKERRMGKVSSIIVNIMKNDIQLTLVRITDP